MKAVEITGTVNERGHSQIDQPLISAKFSRVRAIFLLPAAEERGKQAWLKAVTSSPVFAFLHDPEEDIYTPEDGKPLNDQG